MDRILGKKEEDVEDTTMMSEAQKQLNSELATAEQKSKESADALNLLDEQYKNHLLTTAEYKAKQAELYQQLDENLAQEEAIQQKLQEEAIFRQAL